MRLKTVAKVLLIIFAVLMIVSFIRSCASVVPDRPARVVVPAPTTQPATSGAQAGPAQLPQGQAPAAPTPAQIPVITPLPIKAEQVSALKKGMILEIYDAGCGTSDLYPPTAVFTLDGYMETEVERFSISKLSPSTRLNSDCALARMHFLIYAREAGNYILGLTDLGDNYGSLRVNGVQAVAFGKGGGTGTVMLQQGYYDIDARILLDFSRYRRPYRLSIKRPSEKELQVLSKEDLYYLPIEEGKDAATKAQTK